MLGKKYNPLEAEKKWQSYWQENDIYKYDFESGKETFSIDTPPPTISGSLHIGHIFSYTQAEMIARFQRMQGKNVFYPFGFDDNGLPTERLVEREENIRAAELEGTEKETTFNYIPFLTEGEELIVATTRPELLYGCVCLFVNPKDERYSKYIGKMALVPLYNYEIPILTDEKVSLEKGTGVVMCATFGDTTDLEWYEKHQLPYRRVIEADGKIAGEVPFIGGMKVLGAREEIIKLLKENNLLRKSEAINHTVAIHERCGKRGAFLFWR